MTRKILLACGVLSSLLYVGMNVFIPLQWPGYSSTSQTISELSAIGAPTRSVWVPLGLVYSVLLAMFGWGVWKSAGTNRALRVVGVLLIAQGLFGLAWPPMHQRAVLAAGGGTLTDSMHIAWSVVTVVLMMLSIGFGAKAFGKRFRLYSVATIAILVTFGVLTALDGPRVQANLPTPWLGIWERISIAVDMIWVSVLAITLWRLDNIAAVRLEQSHETSGMDTSLSWARGRGHS